MKDSKIALAFDGMNFERVNALLERVGRWAQSTKIHDLLDRTGPLVLRLLRKRGVNMPWVDYKLHDTGDTVGLRAAALMENGAKIITVHASGGVEMMRSAVQAVEGKAEIWAITLLTSLNEATIARVYGKERTREEIVHELAIMAQEAGVHGIVCSALEVGMLSKCPELAGMKLVVPGTRSKGQALGQQARSGTPANAVRAGAHIIVAGSQVTKAEDPEAAFRALAEEIGMKLE